MGLSCKNFPCKLINMPEDKKKKNQEQGLYFLFFAKEDMLQKAKKQK